MEDPGRTDSMRQNRWALACMTVAMISGATLAQEVIREGSGGRRAELDEMELKPFPEQLWGTLTEWSTDAPVTPGDLSGKVVLICTWASWYPNALQGLALAQEINAAHASEGLVVIGVHHERGFNGAAAAARAKKASFAYAHDASGEFRNALKVDQDPDFYIIDRAGQLRFADIANSSVEMAVKTLLAESRDDASTLNDRLEAERRQREEEFRRTGSINQEIDLRDLPEVPFDQPTDADWARVEFLEQWPKPIEDPQRSGFQEEPEPVKIALPEAMITVPPMPPTAGRAMVVYFWHPDVVATHEQVVPRMDLLQRQHARDLVVLGVMTPVVNNFSSNTNDQTNDPERLAAIFGRYIRTKDLHHPQTFDPSGELMNSVRQDQYSSNDLSKLFVAAVISSDGTVRWSGPPGHPAFKAAVDQVLRVDPGVRNRRLAEEEYIRSLPRRPGG
ncbi:MAG: hypothetical protein H6811_08560 [Phycisphaeraceae bacterium]|nr:hypothetical protein [Phycisphaeraceae bacterium]